VVASIDDVEDVTAYVGLVVGENVLDDEHLGSASRGPSDGAEDRSALLIGPVVEYLHEQVDVGCGQGIGEEVSPATGVRRSCFPVRSLLMTSGRSKRTP
jgi:hypothetical protein